MRLLLTGGLAATLLLAGCAGPAPLVVTPVAPAAQPAAPAASLNGVARYFGEPLPQATVTAYLLGTDTAVAAVSTDATGKFRMDFPAHAPAGALVRLVAVAGGHTIATLARVPARQVQQAGDEALTYIIDEQRSMVFLALGPRFEALGELSLAQDGVVALAVAEEAFEAFTTALAAVAEAPPVSRDAFEAAGTQALTDNGRLTQTPEVLQAIARALPPQVAKVLVEQADALAVVIRQEVAAGKSPPKASLVGKLPLGDDAVADEVFKQASTDPTGGIAPVTTPDASGALGVVDGRVLDPTATPTITVQ